MLDPNELSSRWQRVAAMMVRLDLDAIVAVDLSRDDIMLGGQRWLTGFSPVGLPAAALIFRDGRVELLSQMLGRTVPAFYAGTGLPIETIAGFSPAVVAERVGQVDAKRVGYAEAGTFSAAIAAALAALPSAPEMVDVSAEFLTLRLRKSAAEQAAVRASCAISDKVWSQVPDLFKVGRKFFEVIADVDHIVKSEGGERGFYLLAGLPVVGIPMQVLSDPEEIAPDRRYMLEISPRFQGYYSQLTAPVVTGADDAVTAAYDDLVASKEFAQPLMVPGADLSEVAVKVEAFLAERGRTIASRSLGHFCGMALEEPRHDPSKPFILEKGMTLIFHPVLAHPELMALMRADTYLIGDAGAERLNAFPNPMLQLA